MEGKLQHCEEWQPDYLDDGFGMKYVGQPRDYSGNVRCTVIRKAASRPSDRGILYVHGFSDYFFQAEMANVFVAAGYNFYAVDLRKYGRSLLPDQKMFQVRDLHEYFSDLGKALGEMKRSGIRSVVLMGHSTGGLVTSLYMTEHPDSVIRALILNSPFLDWNLHPLLKLAMPLVSALGRILPKFPVRQKPDRGYAETLADDLCGEWSYRKGWKPDILPDVDAGWVRAIHRAQKQLRRRHIRVPVLLLHSSASVLPGDDKDKYYHADAILNVESISRYGRRLGEDVTEVTIQDGLHDLMLSPKPIRETVYAEILDWLLDLIS